MTEAPKEPLISMAAKISLEMKGRGISGGVPLSRGTFRDLFMEVEDHLWRTGHGPDAVTRLRSDAALRQEITLFGTTFYLDEKE